MLVIPALKMLRQEDLDFKATLDYLVRPCLKKQNKKLVIIIVWFPGVKVT
jgi:hypothetical protein